MPHRFVSYILGKCGLVTRAQMDEAIGKVRKELQDAHTKEVGELLQQITLLKRPCSQRSLVQNILPVCEVCPKHLALVDRTEGCTSRLDEVVTRLETLMADAWPGDTMQEEMDRRLVEATAE